MSVCIYEEGFKMPEIVPTHSPTESVSRFLTVPNQKEKDILIFKCDETPKFPSSVDENVNSFNFSKDKLIKENDVSKMLLQTPKILEEQPQKENKLYKLVDSKMPKLINKDTKQKHIIRPSTAVRKRVKKISEEFFLTQSKYENALKPNSSQNKTHKNRRNGGDNTDLSKSSSPKIKRNTLNNNNNNNSNNNAMKIETSVRVCKSSLMTNLPTPGSFPNNKTTPTSLSFPSFPCSSNSVIRSSITTNTNTHGSPKKLKGTANFHKKPIGSHPVIRLKSTFKNQCENGHQTNVCAPKFPYKRKSHSAHSVSSPRFQQVSFEQLKKAKAFTERAIKVRKFILLLK